jgi:hypothetical protein
MILSLFYPSLIFISQSLRPFLVLLTHLLDLSNGNFPRVFPTKITLALRAFPSLNPSYALGYNCHIKCKWSVWRQSLFISYTAHLLHSSSVQTISSERCFQIFVIYILVLRSIKETMFHTHTNLGIYSRSQRPRGLRHGMCFSHSKSGIVDSNANQGMDACLCLFCCLCCHV